jgi:sec-independent protein translocase protein TatA
MKFGWVELLIILAIVLLIFGATKLPSIAKDLGRSISEFRKASKGDPEEEEKAAEKKTEASAGTKEKS